MISIWVVAFTRPNAYLDLCRLNLVFGIFEKIFWLQCLFINCPPKLAFSKMMSLCNQKLNILQKKICSHIFGLFNKFLFFYTFKQIVIFFIAKYKRNTLHTHIFNQKDTHLFFGICKSTKLHVCTVLLYDTAGYIYQLFICIFSVYFANLLYSTSFSSYSL